MNNFFSSNIRYLREQESWSQEKMAEEVSKKMKDNNVDDSVNRSTISRWESNIIQPTLGNLISVADTFNISLLDLVDRDLRIKDSKPNKNMAREVFVQALIENDYIKKGEDITDENFDRLMALYNIMIDKK